MFNRNSDYALNKHSPYIVYRFADGSCLEVKPEDCPDFDCWKALSDEDYHRQELHDRRIARDNLPLEEDACGCVDDLFEDELPGEFTLENAMVVLEQCLTETQRRRYLLHCHDGLTMRQIASLERVDHMAIQHSIAAAKKKIKNF